jgi:hypothetical protein
MQKRKTGLPVNRIAIALDTARRCFGVDKYALFCYICAGLGS